ncbi:uncharacterized protein N7500_002969 [Penicillium coprophilum]|uniref:uncharacterized protein n=1 Tax=Penicillium coprophilum TaxID=36646 RepID=UPI002391E4C7|nr:uncharacterized protein N7500_002969 [Penicillium coprophilum]KAJ5170186.1 hypothetical protein N7500_002969 [Penicillium coprophilum]
MSIDDHRKRDSMGVISGNVLERQNLTDVIAQEPIIFRSVIRSVPSQSLYEMTPVLSWGLWKATPAIATRD